MKKITLLLLLVSLSLMSFAKLSPVIPSGSGSATDPYLIGTSAEMVWFLSITGFDTYHRYYELTADIDLAPGIIGTDYTPMMTIFYGYLDGKGHTISNYEIKYTTFKAEVGLIARLGMGSITNLVVKNATVSSLGNYVGSVVGQAMNNVSMTNIYVINSAVSGGSYVGGVMGKSGLSNTLKNYFVYNSTISGTSDYVAGVVGYLSSSLQNVMCAFSTVVGANNSVGGVAGRIDSGRILTNGFNYGGSVSGGGTFVGGVIASSFTPSLNLFSAQVSINATDQAEALLNSKGSLVGIQTLEPSSYYAYDTMDDQIEAIGKHEYAANGPEPTTWGRSTYDLTHDGGNTNLDFNNADIYQSDRLYPCIRSFTFDESNAPIDVLNYARLAASPVILTNGDHSYSAVTNNVILGGSGTLFNVQWESSNPAILVVNGQVGEVKASGTVTLTASIGTYSKSYTLTLDVPLPKWKADIEENSLYAILTNFESVRSNDTIEVEVGSQVKAVLSLLTSHFDATLFDIVAIKKDIDGKDVFVPMTNGVNDTVIFTMPDTTVRITTLVNLTGSDSIPHQLDYLELHEGSSLINKPNDGAITIDNHIMYKRTFTSNTWHSISFPFTVNRVTVLEDGVEYDITPCASATDALGNYYLKYIANGVAHAEYASSWQFETTIQKNKPYIIAFPHTYYDGKEITFYGDAQTINDASNLFITSSDGASQIYDYYANTSFNTQIIQDPYLLNATGALFEKSAGSYVLNPFMSYVHSVLEAEQTASSPSKISFNDLLNPRTISTSENDVLNETNLSIEIQNHVLTLSSDINQQVDLYTIMGQKVISLQIQEDIFSEIRLLSGIYVIRSISNKPQIIVIK